MLEVVEVNADGRALTHIAFDIDDFDAAVAELDARYLAGEGPPMPARGRSSCRPTPLCTLGELPAVSQSYVNIDHRMLRETIDAVLGSPTSVSPGGRARLQRLHRGSAPTERPRSGVHRRDAWDLTRGLRRRVANDSAWIRSKAGCSTTPKDSTSPTSTLRSRGSMNSPVLRRGWKTRQPVWPTAMRRPSRPVTGLPWQN